ncbi:MAG: hypothetical protein EGR97_00355 [Clostridiales bacterium]|nr:hypothetical protein [Clostridiales bacterium]MBD8945767.1 hypothetical protein [Clostridiales bacterium]
MNGNITVKYGDEETGIFVIDNLILTASVIQETRKIATELPASTLDLELDVRDYENFEFAVTKPLYIYSDTSLIQKTFITEAKKTSQYRWMVNSTDYIGMMDYLTYDGKFYYQQTFEAVMEDLFSGTNIPYYIDNYTKQLTVSGQVAAGTVRSALQEICFSFGAYVTTANCDGVTVQRLSNDVSQNISTDRIMAGINVENKETITKLSIGYSNFVSSEESISVTKSFDNDFITGNLGKWVTFNLDVPCEFKNRYIVGNYYSERNATGQEGRHDLFTDFETHPHYLKAKVVEELSDGIVEGIKTLDGGWLAFVAYPYMSVDGGVLEKQNPVDSALPIINEKSLNTLGTMTSENAQTALDRIFDNLTVGLKIDAKIIDGRNYLTYGSFKFGEKIYGFEHQNPINIGDIVTIETPNNGIQTGFVQKATYKLFGSTKVVKSCEII